jgi:hypothetical protein
MAYMGIDLAPIRNRRVVDADLSVTFAPTGMGFAALVPDATFVLYGVTDDALDDWDEKTINWMTAPANRPNGAGLDPDKVVRLGSFVVPQGQQTGTHTVGGPALMKYLQADANRFATFVLVRETVGTKGSDLVHGVASRRHPTLSPPTLRLTVIDPR